MEKLNDIVMNLAKKKVIDTLEICEVDHNEQFIKCTRCNALQSLLLSILEVEAEI